MLPLAVEKAKASYKTIGFDIQESKVEMINASHNYIGDVVNEDLRELVNSGLLSATTDYAQEVEADCVCICVPTPLDEHQQPVISYVKSSAESKVPGNLIYNTKNTPKVVGGITPKCTEIAATLYESILEAPIHRVSSPAVAEMEKILGNTYRQLFFLSVNTEKARLYSDTINS